MSQRGDGVFTPTQVFTHPPKSYDLKLEAEVQDYGNETHPPWGKPERLRDTAKDVDDFVKDGMGWDGMDGCCIRIQAEAK